jgi:two-component system, NtrC family, nitrogen regulation sensor histidine kinase NtrY
MNTQQEVQTSALQRLKRALDTMSRPSIFALGVTFLTLLSGFLTYGVLAGILPFQATPTMLVVLLVVNLALGLALGALIGWRLVRLWSERRSGRAGARLHVRLVGMFSAIAVIPAILVAIFAAVTLNLGVEAWFSGHVKAAVDGAENVSKLYMRERARGIYKDAEDIAYGLQNDSRIVDLEAKKVDIVRMSVRLSEMTHDRGLLGSFLVDSHGVELASSTKMKYSKTLKPTASDFADARAGNTVIDGDPETGIVHALIHLSALNDAYLLVASRVDPKVFNYYRSTQSAVNEYQRLERDRSRFQLLFAAFYGVVSLVILLAAIWLGLWAANRLVRPISRLIGAAERVSEGDLSIQVEVARDDDEMATLGRTFNRMTHQLESQRNALVAANRQIDERRRFTETVLAGVSAGVIGLDADGQLTIINRAAARLLNAAPEELEGRHYAEAVPELSGLIRRALAEPIGRAGGEVAVKRDGTSRTLSVQVVSEHGRYGGGYVATFDDITDLVSAQRTAAWADVARRIAHEIKNPLTPIQLAAERLKRKYGKEIDSDPEVFEQCTNTIIRQVGDIGRMVDEFSSFARMPRPTIRRECAQELMQQAVFLQKVGHPKIAYETKAPKDMVWIDCDGRLISQALTNIIKNAAEGVDARIEKGDDAPGRIGVALELNAAQMKFVVTDNGIGLPAADRHRLTEPYVTTRAKGTGLGLAIVRKIVEDHGGELLLEDAEEEGRGAKVTLSLPLPAQKADTHTSENGGADEQTKSAGRI